MLKITFVLESNIRSKMSKARLSILYNRAYLIMSYFSRKLQGSYTQESSKFKFCLRRHKTTIMRSPFHYKTSKTILARPSCKFYISVLLQAKPEQPLFMNSCFVQLLKNLNYVSTFSCTKIVCKDFYVKF